jgi:hypothetical protein
MELYIAVRYDNLNPLDNSRESDSLLRGIQIQFPNAIWEKSGLGYKVNTLG